MNRKQFVLLVMCTILFAFIGGVMAVGIFQGSPVTAQSLAASLQTDFTLPDGTFIGIVTAGKLHVLVPKPSFAMPVRLTEIQMQEARSVESAEIDLLEYEGHALLFTGYHGGTWIYGAKILDHGGPLLAVLVKKVFN